MLDDEVSCDDAMQTWVEAGRALLGNKRKSGLQVQGKYTLQIET